MERRRWGVFSMPLSSVHPTAPTSSSPRPPQAVVHEKENERMAAPVGAEGGESCSTAGAANAAAFARQKQAPAVALAPQAAAAVPGSATLSPGQTCSSTLATVKLSPITATDVLTSSTRPCESGQSPPAVPGTYSTGPANGLNHSSKPASQNGTHPASFASSSAVRVQTHLPGAPVPAPVSIPVSSPAGAIPVPGQPVPVQSFSIGVADPTQTKASHQLSTSAPSSTACMGRASSWDQPATGGPGSPANLNKRRQKRLERNRESARLSRRRRKHYLEELEERVTVLSEQMDRGRRDHVAVAVKTVRSKRREKLVEIERDLNLNFSDLSVSVPRLPAPATIPALEHNARVLDTSLSRTSAELRLAATFQKEQLKSLAQDPTKKFIFWLTLQSDTYFRGGRAPSERLSAARIGERMLHSGNDRVTPANGMWPLLCNEVGLSYDQEEKVRCFQRNLISNQQTWLHRHTGNALDSTIESAHMAVLTVNDVVRQRERSVLNVLTLEQRAKFQAWAASKAERIGRVAQTMVSKAKEEQSEEPKVPQASPNLHDAANLYIMNYRLRRVCEQFPAAQQLVAAALLKKLSRRPSFESLGNCSGGSLTKMGDGDFPGRKLSRERSFPSSGSLKRSASELSMSSPGDATDGSKDANSVSPTPTTLTPEAAQTAAGHVVNAALSCVRDIIPPPPRPQVEYVMSSAVSRPMQQQPPQPQAMLPQPQPQPQAALQPPPPPSQPLQQPQYQHYPLQQAHYQQAQPVTQPTAYVPEAVPSSGYQPASVQPQIVSASIPIVQAPVQTHAQVQVQAQAQAQAPVPTQVVAQIPAEILAQAPADAAAANLSNPTAIPSVMNIVPEEGYLNSVSGQADEFLFDLTEEDWAIGGGFDMDVS